MGVHRRDAESAEMNLGIVEFRHLFLRKRPDNRTFAGRFDRGMIVPEVPEMLRVQPDL